jgi:hypothetical protein
VGSNALSGFGLASHNKTDDDAGRRQISNAVRVLFGDATHPERTLPR